MDGIGRDMINIKELIQRLGNQDVKEIIMTTNPTIEGEATAMYIARLIKPMVQDRFHTHKHNNVHHDRHDSNKGK